MSRERLNRLVALALLSSIASASSGCMSSGGFGPHSTSSQDFILAGSPEGIRAFNDGYIGMVKTGKEAPDAPNQYIQYRNLQEKELTTREIRRKGFIQKLFGSDETEKGS